MTIPPHKRGLDGRYRSALRTGMRVAVVLKLDQPTGKRTFGEIAQLLTPSDFHPRGIKVRLRDGQVGRVQEVLPSAPLPVLLREADPAAARPDLILLVVRRGDGALYARRTTLPDGESLTALGLDAPSRTVENIETTVRALAAAVSPCAGDPRRIAPAIPYPELGCAVHPFVIEGSTVNDDQSSVWEWAGWLSATEIAHDLKAGKMSPESEMVLSLLGVSPQ